MQRDALQQANTVIMMRYALLTEYIYVLVNDIRRQPDSLELYYFALKKNA